MGAAISYLRLFLFRKECEEHSVVSSLILHVSVKDLTVDPAIGR